jgi:hypothetical protein
MSENEHSMHGYVTILASVKTLKMKLISLRQHSALHGIIIEKKDHNLLIDTKLKSRYMKHKYVKIYCCNYIAAITSISQVTAGENLPLVESVKKVYVTSDRFAADTLK